MIASCMQGDEVGMGGMLPYCQVGSSPAGIWPLGLLFALFVLARRRRSKDSLR